MKGILHVGRRIRRTEEPFVVCLVVREQHGRGFPIRPRAGLKGELAQCFVGQCEAILVGQLDTRLQGTAFVPTTPGPSIAEPDCRKEMQRGEFRAPVVNGDPYQHIVRRRLGILGHDIEVAVLGEGACVGQFKLRGVEATASVLLNQLPVRELGLRILIECLRIGMRRRGIEVEVLLLHILPVIPLRPRQAEQALLQDGVLPVPQRQRKAQPALAVGHAQQAIFTPAIGAATRMVVRERVPAGTVRRVVLPDGGPLALGEIWPPAFPVRCPCDILAQPPLFFRAISLSAYGLSPLYPPRPGRSTRQRDRRHYQKLLYSCACLAAIVVASTSREAKASARGKPRQSTGSRISTFRFGIRPAICSIALLLHPYEPMMDA